MFDVFLTNRAEKSLKSINKKDIRDKIVKDIDTLIYSCFPKNYDIKKLKGYKNTYRIRVGKYRIIYYVDFKNKKIYVLSILHRK